MAAVSCEKHAQRREGCRRSWMLAGASRPDLQVVFVVGHSEVSSPVLGGDTLYVPCDDDYEGLPQKTWCVARWAVEQGFRRLFKCDDDTYVHLERLGEAIPSLADFTGFINAPGAVSGGAGYLLAGDSLVCIARDMEQYPRGAEDVIVTDLLKRRGIAPRMDRRFQPGAQLVPSVYNEQITAHYVDPVSMLDLHISLQKPRSPLFRLIRGVAEFGAIGVHGYRGFKANAVSRVQVPAEFAAANDELISAHASSEIEIEFHHDVHVRGFLDEGAGRGGSDVMFSVDDAVCDIVAQPGAATGWVAVGKGAHVLKVVSKGSNSSRYSVWQVRPKL
ncbi:MAG TPA: hypothetical protein VGE52_19415 [Pirellulales bacterium]